MNTDEVLVPGKHRDFLRSMHDSHVVNIENCAALL